MTETGLPEDTAAPADAPAPEAPQVEADRLASLEQSVKSLTETLSQALTRETPPTTANDEDEQAKAYRDQLETEAANNPALRHALTISQGLYLRQQADNAKLTARLDLAEIEDKEERELTRQAYDDGKGEFKSVAAARRAVKGDLAGREPAPKPKPDLDEQRREVERVKSVNASPRAVGAPDFKKRMTDNDYVARLNDPNMSIEEKVKLRRERAGA